MRRKTAEVDHYSAGMLKTACSEHLCYSTAAASSAAETISAVVQMITATVGL
jgi:hypothetical protein